MCQEIKEGLTLAPTLQEKEAELFLCVLSNLHHLLTFHLLKLNESECEGRVSVVLALFGLTISFHPLCFMLVLNVYCVLITYFFLAHNIYRMMN